MTHGHADPNANCPNGGLGDIANCPAWTCDERPHGIMVMGPSTAPPPTGDLRCKERPRHDGKHRDGVYEWSVVGGDILAQAEGLANDALHAQGEQTRQAALENLAHAVAIYRVALLAQGVPPEDVFHYSMAYQQINVAKDIDFVQERRREALQRQQNTGGNQNGTS